MHLSYKDFNVGMKCDSCLQNKNAYDRVLTVKKMGKLNKHTYREWPLGTQNRFGCKQKKVWIYAFWGKLFKFTKADHLHKYDHGFSSCFIHWMRCKCRACRKILGNSGYSMAVCPISELHIDLTIHHGQVNHHNKIL